MIKNREIEVKDVWKEPYEMECDICHKVFSCKDDIFETQEFVNIRFIGGYGSVFGDGDTVEIDICQNCFKEKLGEHVRITDEC